MDIDQTTLNDETRKLIHKLADSGERMSFGEGRADREPTTGKGHFDYITPVPIQRLLDAIEEDRDIFEYIIDGATRETLINDVYKYMFATSEDANGCGNGTDNLALALFCAMELYEFEYNGKTYSNADFISVAPRAIKGVAIHYELGAQKYAPFNWCKGMATSRYFDSAMRHFGQYQQGLTDEPHLQACIWNIMGLMHTETMMPSFNDLHKWERD